jgi:hypothetical protein
VAAAQQQLQPQPPLLPLLQQPQLQLQQLLLPLQPAVLPFPHQAHHQRSRYCLLLLLQQQEL